jgi:hypothetical protein
MIRGEDQGGRAGATLPRKRGVAGASRRAERARPAKWWDEFVIGLVRAPVGVRGYPRSIFFLLCGLAARRVKWRDLLSRRVSQGPAGDQTRRPPFLRRENMCGHRIVVDLYNIRQQNSAPEIIPPHHGKTRPSRAEDTIPTGRDRSRFRRPAAVTASRKNSPPLGTAGVTLEAAGPLDAALLNDPQVLDVIRQAIDDARAGRRPRW